MGYFDQLGPLARAIVREAPYEVDLGQALTELHNSWRKTDNEGFFIPPTDQEKAKWLKAGIKSRKWS